MRYSLGNHKRSLFHQTYEKVQQAAGQLERQTKVPQAVGQLESLRIVHWHVKCKSVLIVHMKKFNRLLNN